jgi:hypothetical protein
MTSPLHSFALDTQVIAIRKKALGEDHPDYGTGLSDLSFIYRNQERYAEAEPLLIQANEIEKKSNGRRLFRVCQSIRK